MEGLNGMELGDKLLRVQLASVGMKQAPGVELGVNAMAMMAGTTSAELEQGRVLQLLNMVTTDELMDPEEYEGGAWIPQHLTSLQCSIQLTYYCAQQRLRKISAKSARNLEM